MATVYSDELVNLRAGRRQQANVFSGKARVIKWNFASLAAGNVGDVLVCGKIRKNDRVVFGREAHSALTSGGSTATGAYGIYAVTTNGDLGAVVTVDKFLVATSFEAAGGNLLADTIAHNIGFEADADYFLCCTNSVEAFATAGRVTGVMLVVND